MKNSLETEPAKLESKPVTPAKREPEPVKSAKLEPQESFPAKSELEPAKQPKKETEPTPAPEPVKQQKLETEPTPVSDSAKPAQPPPTPKVSLEQPLPGYRLTSVTLLLNITACTQQLQNTCFTHILTGIKFNWCLT